MIRRPRRARAALGLPLAAAGALAGVLAGEAYLAATREYLPTDPGYRVDGHVVPAGATQVTALRLSVLGDSTVAGVGATVAEESLAVLVAQRVAQALARPVTVHALGVSGARTDDIAALQVPRIGEVAGAADVVLVVVGSNDVTHLTPPLGFGARTARMLAAVHAATGAPVVLGGIPEFGTVPALPQPLRALAGRYAVILRAAQRRAALASPCTSFVDIAAQASPRFLGRPESMSPDGFHPSAVGYGLWADALAPAVAAAAQVRR